MGKKMLQGFHNNIKQHNCTSYMKRLESKMAENSEFSIKKYFTVFLSNKCSLMSLVKFAFVLNTQCYTTFILVGLLS